VLPIHPLRQMSIEFSVSAHGSFPSFQAPQSSAAHVEAERWSEPRLRRPVCHLRGHGIVSLLALAIDVAPKVFDSRSFRRVAPSLGTYGMPSKFVCLEYHVQKLHSANALIFVHITQTPTW
jgi:hypothetical protein